jgi:type I restriction enzyme, S subunit
MKTVSDTSGSILVEQTENASQKPLPDGWRWVRLGEVCEQPQYGYTAPATRQDTGVNLLRISDIQNGQVDWQSVPFCEILPEEASKYLLARGDILFARTGATTGKSFLIQNAPSAVFASYLIRVRPRTEILLPEYLYAFLQSEQYWGQVETGKRGGAQPNMNATLLADVIFPLPPLAEQKRIAARLNEIMAEIARARAAAQAQLEALNALPAVYLRRAFTGELDIKGE